MSPPSSRPWPPRHPGGAEGQDQAAAANMPGAKVSSDALGVQPVSRPDFGWVSCPCLWWLSVDWTRLASDPEDGSPLEWAKKGRWDRLRVGGGQGLSRLFRPGGMEFHSSGGPGQEAHAVCHDPGAYQRRAVKPRSTRGGPLATQTPVGWRAVASSPHGTTP